MSFWAKVQGVSITDINTFKRLCDKHDVDFTDSNGKDKFQGSALVGVLTDRVESHYPRKQAYLVKDGDKQDGSCKLIIDNDVNYSSLSKRLGKNGGVLMRDYTQQMVMVGVKKNGGIVNSVTETPNGAIIMKISAVG